MSIDVMDCDCRFEFADMLSTYVLDCAMDRYWNLEKYSTMATDLSNVSLAEFEKQYKTLLQVSCDLLKDGGYFGIVTGDFLDLDKAQYSFSSKTDVWIQEVAVENGKMVSMGGITLLTSTGTAAMRADKNAKQGRITRTTQRLSIFLKKAGKYKDYQAPAVYKELGLSMESDCNSQEH